MKTEIIGLIAIAIPIFMIGKTVAKKSFWKIFLLLAIVGLNSCKKLQDTPQPIKITQTHNDTVPDKSFVGIILGIDSVQTDETLLEFNKSASQGYSIMEDARYLQGFGLISLSSLIGSDPMAINTQPFSDQLRVRLNVNTRNDGSFYLKISRMSMPDYVDVWLKDNYLRDSLSLRTGNYQFQVLHNDTSTFGKNRFVVYFKGK